MAFAALVLASRVLAAGPEMFRLRDPGERLPPLTLVDLEGQPHELLPRQLEGPVVLFFWSVYCPNCKEAMPDLVKLHGMFADRRLAVWAINVDGERFSNAVRAYVREMNLPFPVLYDRLEGEYLVAADPLGVSKTPSLYVAGADGRIALRQIVRTDFDAVRRSLDTLEP